MLLDKIKKWSYKIKKNINILYRAYIHKRTPWYTKLLIGIVIAYALSPIDLIPDFIPVLGYLDDLLLIPAGIALSFKLIPGDVLKECKNMKDEEFNLKSKGKIAAVFITIVWAALFYIIIKAIIK